MESSFYSQLADFFSSPVTHVDTNQNRNCQLLKVVASNILEQAQSLGLFDDADEPIHISAIQRLIDNNIDKYQEILSKPWLGDKITIGFLGHMNAGKTTALNSLFDETFPVSANECTPLGTYLSYGTDTQNIKIVDKIGDYQVISSESSYIFDYKISEGFPFARFFDYIQKENASYLLKKISIFDTPGIGSTVIEHLTPTINAIKYCNVIFWFDKVSGGFGYPILEFIKKYASDKINYFVFTFVDDLAYADEEEEINEAINTLLHSAKTMDIEVAGHFKFGLSKEIQSTFKQQVSKEMTELSDTFPIESPLAEVFQLFYSLRELAQAKSENYHKEKTVLENKIATIANEYQSQVNDYSAAHNSVYTATNNLINTFISRCSAATFCGGASGAMCTQINNLTERMQHLSTTYSEIDFRNLTQCGQIHTLLSQVDEKIEATNKFINDLNEFFDTINN